MISAVAPQGPLMLVGHSMGGMTVMSLAADYPDLIAGVLAVALLGTSSGGMADASFGLPKPVARGDRMTPFVAPALVTRGALSRRAGSGPATSPISCSASARFIVGAGGGRRVQRQHDRRDAVGSGRQLLPTLTSTTSVMLWRSACIEVLVMVGKSDKMTPLDHSFEIIRTGRRTPSWSCSRRPGTC